MSSTPPSAPDQPELTPADLASAESGSTAIGPAEGKPAESDPADCASRLRALFPALFGGAAKPLKLRIQSDIQARAPGVFTRRALSAFLHRHTGSTSYLLALAKATQRFDLDGVASGAVSDEHRAAAEAELQRRRANHEARRAVLGEQRRNRANLLRDFEGTTLARADFCATKGVAPEALDDLLAIARREADERARRAANSERQRRAPQRPWRVDPPHDETQGRLHSPRDRPRTSPNDPTHDRRRPAAAPKRDARVPAAPAVTTAATPAPPTTAATEQWAERDTRPDARRRTTPDTPAATRRPAFNARFAASPAAPPTAMQAALEAALRAASIVASTDAGAHGPSSAAAVGQAPIVSPAAPTAPALRTAPPDATTVTAAPAPDDGHAGAAAP